MKKYYSLCIVAILSFFGAYVLADEWLDIAEDLKNKIGTEVTLSAADQKHLDINLIWAHQCVEKQSHCPTDNEKRSIRETVENLEKLWEKYQELGIESPVLEYIVNKAEILRSMTEEESLPVGPVLADIVLQIYYQDTLQKYESTILKKVEKHHTALKYLPEGAIIPAVPKSKTNQAIVIDISDQRLYAFEDEMLIYTNPITSGKNGFGTVQGDFSVMNKQKNRLLRSPFKNISYSLHVDYWIQFYPKYGIHDACNSKSCWRKEFGGPDYTSRGSHGCVNTPYDAVKWLYNWSLEGTAVRVKK